MNSKFQKVLLTALVVFTTAISVQSQSFSQFLIMHIPIEKGILEDTISSRSIVNSGASFTIDRYGRSQNALEFDGNSDKLTIDHNNLLLDTFAWSIWVKFDEHPSIGNVTFILNLGGNLKDAGLNLANNYAGFTGFSGFTYMINGSSAANYTTGSLPSLGAWHHIVINRYTDKIQMYLNGILVGTSSANSGAAYTGSNIGFWIGSRLGQSNYFKGIIDDIQIYSRPLEASEVISIYSRVNNVIIEDKGLRIYPNPSSGSISITGLGEEAEVTIFDLTGRSLDQVSMNKMENEMHIQDLKSGVYFVKIQDGENVTSHKIIVQ